METQRSIGEVKAAVDALRVSVESTKSKVDDLVNWKNRILGGVLVLGALISIVGFLVAKFSDYITITAPAPQVQPTVVSMPTQPPPVPTHLPTGKK